MCVYLQLPEDAACVSVVVVPEWDVLHATAVGLQVAFHVLKEPGLEVQTDPVDLMVQTDRHKDRQTDRKKGSQTDRQKGRPIDRQTDRHTGR